MYPVFGLFGGEKEQPSIGVFEAIWMGGLVAWRAGFVLGGAAWRRGLVAWRGGFVSNSITFWSLGPMWKSIMSTANKQRTETPELILPLNNAIFGGSYCGWTKSYTTLKPWEDCFLAFTRDSSFQSFIGGGCGGELGSCGLLFRSQTGGTWTAPEVLGAIESPPETKNLNHLKHITQH